MKLNKLFSILLATALVCGLLCTPVMAASNEVLGLDDGFNIWLNTEEILTKHDVPVRLSYCGYNDDGSIIRNAEEVERTISKLNQLPLGVTLTIGPNSYIDSIFVYSDPDGDGCYEQRLCCYLQDGNPYKDYEVVPLNGPAFIPRDDKAYANYFEWYQGADWLGNGPVDDLYTGGYRTLSTDYLTELFGANSILEFQFLQNSEDYLLVFSTYWLLTGQERTEDLGDDSIENYGVTVSDSGHLTSIWAGETVSNAYNNSLVPFFVEYQHSYDMRGSITRAEFAAIAVALYQELTGTVYQCTRTNPFADVDEEDDCYPWIQAAYELGIVKGRTTTAFKPGDLVSRQDAALMLSRVFTLLDIDVPEAASTTFADDVQISGYARDAVAFMSSKGIINGVGGNRFNPKGNTTVEQALKIALSMLEQAQS